MYAHKYMIDITCWVRPSAWLYIRGLVSQFLQYRSETLHTSFSPQEAAHLSELPLPGPYSCQWNWTIGIKCAVMQYLKKFRSDHYSMQQYIYKYKLNEQIKVLLRIFFVFAKGFIVSMQTKLTFVTALFWIITGHLL